MNRTIFVLAAVATLFLLVHCRSLDVIRYGLSGGDITQMDEVDERPYDPETFRAIELDGFSAEDVDHPWVLRELRAFERSKHAAITSALRRATNYLPTIKTIFAEEHLPLDLVYLPIIESSFNPKATSPTGAKGLWQFMYHTGRFYKLEASYWHDDRSNIVASTRAAAHHLKWLYKQYNDWLLVLAAYNAGSGKVSRGLKRYKTTDFWSLAKHRYLKRETKRYVPKFIAATIIAKNAERYGLPSFDDEAVELVAVRIEDATDLKLVASCAGMNYNEIRRHNPALKRWLTPPSRSFDVFLPTEKQAVFLSNFGQIPDNERITFRRTFVGIGDSLSSIANQYQVPINPIAEINKLASIHKIVAGTHLLIPIRGLRQAKRTPPPNNKRNDRNDLSNASNSYAFLHIVQGTDSLYGLALRFNVSLVDLMRWNELKHPNLLRPGRLLLVRQAEARVD